jgi:hypothetical protein
MIRQLHLVLFAVFLSLVGYGQEIQPAQSIFIIDCPTAATLDRGSFLGEIRAYTAGGLQSGLRVGLSDRFMIGISYGGSNIIGEGSVDWNPNPGVELRYRMFHEQLNFPAISAGFNNQGYGAYIDSLERYSEKSKGVFLAASKSYRFLGALAFHGGINYSFETGDNDKGLNGFIAIEKSINEEVGIFVEYDLAMNDNTGKNIGSGKGYLNASLKWSFGGQVFIDFIWKNILHNKNNQPHSSRQIRLYFVQYF